MQLSGNVSNDSQLSGIAVTFSGAASGSTTTDANGDFSFTTGDASLGTVYASGVDEAGQSTNIASAAVAVNSPVLYLSSLDNSDATVTLAGTVSGIDPASRSL